MEKNGIGTARRTAICNLYSAARTQDELRGLFDRRQVDDRLGNLEPRDQVYPDQGAPIVHLDGETIVLKSARWGMPSPKQYHSASGIDRGVTNIRNTGSPHWRRWLGPQHRCLVPLTAFAEPLGKSRGNAWFRFPDDATPMFAGIWVEGWTSIRKLKDGETKDDLFAFLTTEPNAEVAPIHPKAMPVILTEQEEWETWLTAEWAEAKALQSPLTDGMLEVENGGQRGKDSGSS
ncbi:SOS response-associated peptidase [Palleronia abyssalis]|nr:SOS response-associated peptidase [Palleronia abyssalis]